MRITESSMLSRLLDQLTSAKRQSAEALERLADGKKIRRGSDDPLGAAESLRLRADFVRSEGYKRTGSNIRYDLSTVDTALTEVFNLLSAARTKALAGGSTVANNETLAREVEGFREELLAVANTRLGNRYLFAGTETPTPAFDTDGNYLGNNEESVVAIDPSTSVAHTVDGSRPFLDAGSVFDTLEDVAAALRADDTAAAEAAISDLNAQLDNLNAVRSDVGIRMQLLDSTRIRLEDQQLRVQVRISEIEDVELDRVAVELAQAETAVSAITTATARALQRSLFDFLG